jgi:hypothetical protein
LARLVLREPTVVAEMRAATLAIDHQMFAGRLDSRQLNWPQRLAVLSAPGLIVDFRDWKQIRGRADTIAARLAVVGSALTRRR